jgi:hypothetical protein
MINARNLKHYGAVQQVTAYDETGQPAGWVTIFNAYFGIDDEAISPEDKPSNNGNKKTLSLFTRFDVRFSNDYAIFLFGERYRVSEVDNVKFANRRINFTATAL